MIQFRVYLARDYIYCKRYIVASIEEAYNIINNSKEYDEYLIVQEDLKLHQDEVLAYGSIPKNRKTR